MSLVIPSEKINISLGPATTSLHTREATMATKTSEADKALLTGVKALAMTETDFLLNPKLIKEAQEEQVLQRERLSTPVSNGELSKICSMTGNVTSRIFSASTAVGLV